MIRGVIFDLDGVVVDSHPLHEEAWRSLLSEAGLDHSFDPGFIYSGLSRREILERYLGPLSEPEIHSFGQRKDEIFSGLVHQVEVQPGLLRVLHQLRAAGLACAVATSAGAGRTHELLGQLGIAQHFQAVVTSCDVRKTKPAPDVFLEAAARLGINPHEAVVIEDSVAGVQAARAADMLCLGYDRGEQAQALRNAGASDVIADFPGDIVSYLQQVADSISISQRRD